MKNFLFCTVAFLAMSTAYASNSEDKSKIDPPKNGVFKTLIKECKKSIDDYFDCVYLVVVFKNDIVIDSKGDRKWVTNEQDCKDLIAGVISAFEEEYPADRGYVVKDVQQQ